MGVVYQPVEVAHFVGEAAGSKQFDQSVAIDEDVGGVHVPYLAVVFLELRPRPHHRVQQVPQLCLQEEAVDLPPVFNLRLENVGVVLEGHLDDPRRPADALRLVGGGDW